MYHLDENETVVIVLNINFNFETFINSVFSTYF